MKDDKRNTKKEKAKRKRGHPYKRKGLRDAMKRAEEKEYDLNEGEYY